MSIQQLKIIHVIVQAAVSFLPSQSNDVSDIYSVLIKGATIEEGMEHLAYCGDILIENDRIIQITKAETIDPTLAITVVDTSELVNSAKEAINVVAKASMKLETLNLKAAGKPTWSEVRHVLKLINEVDRNSKMVYPHQYSSIRQVAC